MTTLGTHTARRLPPLVLLVDDNPDTLEMYALGLQYEGFNVAKAGDGEVALERVSSQKPDCIVADVRMPRMTGLEFRRRLTHSPETADIPVIALTGFAAEPELATARAAGFDKVLVKPCLPETLAREIVRVLQDKNAELARKHRKIRRDRTTD